MKEGGRSSEGTFGRRRTARKGSEWRKKEEAASDQTGQTRWRSVGQAGEWGESILDGRKGADGFGRVKQEVTLETFQVTIGRGGGVDRKLMESDTAHKSGS